MALVLCGCSSVVDHTNNASLRHLLGPKILTEKVWVFEEKNADNPDLQLIQKRGREGLSTDFCQVIVSLNAGENVEIKKIEEKKFRFPFHVQSWILTGEFHLNGDDVVFHYDYASTTDSPDYPTEFIHDVPWE